MNGMVKQKISINDAYQKVSNYFSTISDILDMQITKYDGFLEENHTMFRHGEKIKVISRLHQLEFTDLLQLALSAEGYNVVDLKYFNHHDYEGYLIVHNLLDEERRTSR